MLAAQLLAEVNMQLGNEDEAIGFLDQVSSGLAKLSNFGPKDRYYPIPFGEYKPDPAKMDQNESY